MFTIKLVINKVVIKRSADNLTVARFIFNAQLNRVQQVKVLDSKTGEVIMHGVNGQIIYDVSNDYPVGE